MLVFQAESDKAVIIMHEIYGINRHITDVCAKYHSAGYNVYCPYLFKNRKVFTYHEEAEAYGYFMDNAGFNTTIVDSLISDIRSKHNKIIVSGFSAGATIA